MIKLENLSRPQLQKLALIAAAQKELVKREKKRKAEEDLSEFIRQAWNVLEPANPYVHGWHIDAIAMHLNAIDDGDINRLLINIPPGHMKSLLVAVLWPAYLWGPCNKPHLRFLCVSHSQNLAIRDSTKMRRLITSEWYQENWGDRVKLTGDQNAKTKFENDRLGFREAVAAGSITGSRGDIVIIDDPHSVESAASDQMRSSTIEWFLEAVPTRLNNPEKSSIVVIMQRLHESDVSGVILEKNLGYTHLMLPAEFDPLRKCETEIGFSDPREIDGEVLFPERFPREVLERDKLVMGPYAYAGQMQQSPAPRGGGIIKREWWNLWDDDEAAAQGVNSGSSYPAMDYVVASIDTAYGEKQENDFSALTVWGVWQRGGQKARAILDHKGGRSEVIDDRDTIPAAMLMHAWAKKLPIHGPDTLRYSGETELDYKRRAMNDWGLVEWIIHTCNQFKVDMLLIEAKASGLSIAQEVRRLNRNQSWGVVEINPGSADKVARAYVVQAVFSGGQIYCPDRTWADQVITQFENFPKGKHDDLVDSSTQALKYLKDRNLLRRPEEIVAISMAEGSYRPKSKPVYNV
jgi:predicted phage terminase large subunit-like protein